LLPEDGTKFASVFSQGAMGFASLAAKCAHCKFTTLITSASVLSVIRTWPRFAVFVTPKSMESKPHETPRPARCPESTLDSPQGLSNVTTPQGPV
jgi:hypothetical protein